MPLTKRAVYGIIRCCLEMKDNLLTTVVKDEREVVADRS